jgi:CheY-like chemotaxis protein
MTNKTILLVDDDPDDQLIFKDALNEIGENIECSTVNNGREAMVYLQKMPEPNLIFLDLNMPKMNGFEFLELIKENQRYKKIPIVIYTTSDHPNDKNETMAKGAYLFLTKTADFRTLKKQLQEILNELRS